MYTFFRPGAECLPDILALLGKATARLDELGIRQWDHLYPDRATIEADISSGSLYAIAADTAIAGIFVLNETQDPAYASVAWELDDPRPLVLHRFSIDPAWQGKGLAKACLKYIEDHARERGYRSIRLDAFSENYISLGLYRAHGYRERGQVRFRKGIFWCFEKTLEAELT